MFMQLFSYEILVCKHEYMSGLISTKFASSIEVRILIHWIMYIISYIIIEIVVGESLNFESFVEGQL